MKYTNHYSNIIYIGKKAIVPAIHHQRIVNKWILESNYII